MENITIPGRRRKAQKVAGADFIEYTPTMTPASLNTGIGSIDNLDLDTIDMDAMNEDEMAKLVAFMEKLGYSVSKKERPQSALQQILAKYK